MIAGATLPAVPVYDVPFENPGPPFEKYSWMAYLAEAGFDVFAMELTGYGLSPRPKMDDPCNTDLKNPAQQALLKKPCTHPELSPTFWPKKMAIQSDWDEIDRVVDYVHDLRGVDAVSLVGWSRAGPRIGGYAVQHPEKVEKLVLYSPAAYDRTGPTDGPRDPVTKALMPEPGVLMQLSTVKNFFDNWDRQLKVSGAESICGDQLPPGIRDVLKSGLLESDPVGSSLGKQPLWRAPVQNTLWGWNAETARNIRAPTLIIRGENDDQAPFDPQRELFEDLGADQDSQVDQDGETDQDAEANQKKLRKVFVRVACAGHQLLLERQHTRLLQASGEWLSHGSYAGHHRGSFFVDTQGQVTPAPLEDRNRSLARPTENVDQD